MSSKRYTYREKLRNSKRMYKEQMDKRNVRFIEHYGSPNMSYPNDSQLRKITTLKHVWRHGDRYYKLAHKHYGKSKLWWVIAWFNKAPTESHLITGQTILIPTPLEVIVSYLRDIS